MKIFHISERENRDSILKKGILPNRIALEHHAKRFLSMGIIPSLDSKASYFWIDSEKNEKFIKDMIYCKYWIDPRNYLVDTYYDKYKEFFDFSALDRHWLRKNNGLFDIYTAEVDDWDKEITHSQSPNSSKNNSLYNMNERFAHDDKLLYITPNVIKDLKIVGSVLFETDVPNNTMRFSFNGSS